ncbi:hypothetical protein SK128_008359, partial [Halocaridina rubra]
MVISLDDKIRNMDGEMKDNETLREQIRSLEEANKAQGQERKELEKRIKKLEGEKSQLQSRISKQEDKNKHLNDNLKELDLEMRIVLPVLHVYQSTYFRVEFVLGFDDPVPNLPHIHAKEEKKRAILGIPFVEDLITILGGDPVPCVKFGLCELAASQESLPFYGVVRDISQIIL